MTLPYRRALGALTSATLLLAPASALASKSPNSGGSGLGGAPAGHSGSAGAQASASPTPTVAAQPAATPVSASSDGITVTSQATGIYDQTLAFSGSVPAADAGHTVTIERQRAGQNGWTPTATATATAAGTFSTSWRPNHMGEYRFAVEVASPGTERQAARVGSGAPDVTVDVIGAYTATWYGPGFFGHRTACGQRLTTSTLGVASRTLPCGTKVTLIYAGQEITVPVIDRGPFAHGASWDLTQATAQALGMTETSILGATW